MEHEPLGEPWLSRPLIERFEHLAASTPDKVVVGDGVTQLTYAELRERVHALAARLEPLAPLGRPIAAIIPPTVVYPVVLLAALALGRPIVPVDVSHPFERRAAMLRETRPSVVVLAEGFELEPDILPEPAPIIIERASAPTEAEGARPKATARPSDLAGIAFTSGSTDRPKGLAYTQHATFAFTAENISRLRIGPHDRIISVTSLAAGGNLDILSAILTGAYVRMFDIKSAGMGEVLRVLEAERITLFTMVPMVFRALFSAPGAEQAFASMRAICLGGDRVVGADIALFRSKLPATCAIGVTQGSTESGVVFSWFIPSGLAFSPEETVPSGWIGAGRRFALLDDAGRPMGPGEPGEVVVESSSMAAGVWRDGALRPGPFVPSDAAGAGRDTKIFHSGDVVRMTAEGLVTFVGRRDRQIKIMGLRADPSEVEAALRHQPGVAEVVVIVRRKLDSPVFIAYVRPENLHRLPSPAALREALRAELPAHMVPAEVRYLPSIPRLPNYKPDLVGLDALDQVNAADHVVALEESEAAAPEILRAVSVAWGKLLGEARAAGGRSWDEAGGDSLKALQLVLLLEEALGRRLPFDLFDPRDTAATMALRLTRYMGTEESCEAAAPRPIVFLLPGLWGDEPRLAAMRRMLQSHVRFELLHYPGLDEPLATVGDFEAILAAILRQIDRTQPAGVLNLMGYSIGGAAAFEAALRLRRAGRQIGFLGVLDTYAGIGSGAGRLTQLMIREEWEAAMREAPVKADPLRPVRRSLVNLLVHFRAYELMRRIDRLVTPILGPHRGIRVRKTLIERTRGAAFANWRPRWYDGKLWLFRAAVQDREDAPADLGWTEFCRELEVVDVPGNHRSMLQTELGPLCASVLSAFARAARGALEADVPGRPIMAR